MLSSSLKYRTHYKGSFALLGCHNANQKVKCLCTTVQRSVATSDQFSRLQEHLFENESHWICLHHYSITAVLQGANIHCIPGDGITLKVLTKPCPNQTPVR